VIEFGLRRTQETDAGMKAAKCSYLAGANRTSNVFTGMRYNIPLFGTMAQRALARELERKGYRLNALRLGSGNLLSTSRKVRQILDGHGLNYVKIFASGDLDEYVIEKLLRKVAKIDAFGVGT
jgi:nicotinate phosphoribosyltransferase